MSERSDEMEPGEVLELMELMAQDGWTLEIWVNHHGDFSAVAQRYEQEGDETVGSMIHDGETVSEVIISLAGEMMS